MITHLSFLNTPLAVLSRLDRMKLVVGSCIPLVAMPLVPILKF